MKDSFQIDVYCIQGHFAAKRREYTFFVAKKEEEKNYNKNRSFWDALPRFFLLLLQFTKNIHQFLQ